MRGMHDWCKAVSMFPCTVVGVPILSDVVREADLTGVRVYA